MAFIGSCPDMCPERERKSRVGHSVSIFERDLNNEPNQYAMVKEYRRSGADQEEPAPEDLRTIGALQKTLDYLICNIMNDSRATTQELAIDWYDFLWDRLRAIRKDITQQNICDPNSAILVERCARFHVHSCYAMNRIKDFDVDMNKRNLNDCLQMLRQIYHDLRTSSGTTCPGELEFQKYDILLHLDQDHLSSTILMKCSEYRSSSEMRFITRLFNAYTNNDYYKLFQLMRQADYMTSCLLSLYANKMRLIGLRSIINACVRGQSVLYPSELATEILGFDDDNDLSQFAGAIGIVTQVKDDKMHLVLNRDVLSLLRNSEFELPAFKSRSLVEDKMHGHSVGQMVHGGAELPDGDEIDSSMIVCQESMVDHRDIALTKDDLLRSTGSKRKIEQIEEETSETSLNAIEDERDVKRQKGPKTGCAPQSRRQLEDRTIVVRDEQETSAVEETLIVTTVLDESSRLAEQLEHKNTDTQVGETELMKVTVKEEDEEEVSTVISENTDLRLLHDVFAQPHILTDSSANATQLPGEKTFQPVGDSSSPKSVDNSSEDGYGFLDEEERIFKETRYEVSRPTPEARAEIADVMPAGFFKVRSLTSARPILRPPTALPSDDIASTRRFKPVNNIQKKLDSISLTIEDEKRANGVFARLKDMFTT